MSSASDVVPVGKLRGSTFAAALENDRSYAYWVLTASSLPRSLMPFRRWLRTAHGGVLPCGKHRNKTYAEIHANFPEYAIWVCELGDPNKAMLDFQKFVRRREEAAKAEAESAEAALRPEPALKRPRAPSAGECGRAPPWVECKVCFDRQANAVFLPCKHYVCCGRCAELSESCPVCRGRVSEVLKIYPG